MLNLYFDINLKILIHGEKEKEREKIIHIYIQRKEYLSSLFITTLIRNTNTQTTYIYV